MLSDIPPLSTLALWPPVKTTAHFGRLFTNMKKRFLFERVNTGQDNGNEKQCNDFTLSKSCIIAGVR